VTKVAEGAPLAADIECVAAVYSENGGDLEKIAAACGVPLALLEKAPPLDAHDFARNLLAGLYTGDETELAKSQLREQLWDKLQVQPGRLRRTQTREGPTQPAASDLECVARLYTQHGGDLPKIAALCGIDEDLLRQRPPAGADDFAQQLLKGSYTSNGAELTKSRFRDQLFQNIRAQGQRLKRTETKEGNAKPQASDIERLARIYDDNGGDLEKLAGVFAIDMALLAKAKPAGARDFARNLLEGFYTGDSSELAKSQLRGRLFADLNAQSSKLRRTETREGPIAPGALDVESVADIYRRNAGDLDMLAVICGAHLDMLRKSPPADADDFARKLFEGLYTGDTGDIAKASLRERMPEKIAEQLKKLKRTETKECKAIVELEASDVDLERMANIYTDKNGDLDAIATVCGINVQAIQRWPPNDATEFARRLLAGHYTFDTSLQGQRRVRKHLVGSKCLLDSIQELAKTIKWGRPYPNKCGVLRERDIWTIQDYYEDHNGDLDELAALCGVAPELLRRIPPEDSEDFARKLLEGWYSAAEPEPAEGTAAPEPGEGVAA